jgi:hypothetical protein
VAEHYKHGAAAHRFCLQPKKSLNKSEIVDNCNDMLPVLLVQQSRRTQVTSLLPCHIACHRRCESVTSFKVGFPFIQVVKQEYTVVKHIVCSSIFAIANGGRTSTRDHHQTKNQKTVMFAKSQWGCMTNCLRKLEPSKAEYDLAVYKGLQSLSFHSFRSTDFTTTLQRKSADKKFSCARTKLESVFTNVYVPWAPEELKNYLKCMNFDTVSCDTSNHKHVKQLPILVRYFQGYDLENPVKNKLLLWKSQGKLQI